jgi:hypothetical protein
MSSVLVKSGSWIAIAIGVVGSVASVTALQGNLRWIFGTAGLVIIASGLSYILGSHQSSNKKGKVDVFTRRPRQSLDDELGNAKEIWLCWHSGNVKLAQGDLFNTPRKIRMILTHPDSPALREIERITNLPLNQIQESIKLLTTKVKRNGGKVVWFKGTIQNSLILADPENSDPARSWARLEVLTPYQDPVSRPSIKVYKRDDPDLFNRLEKCFDDLWERSDGN